MPTRYDLEILIRARKEGNGVDDANKEVENLGKRLNSTLKVIEASGAAALAAGATFKQAFELGKEGRAIDGLEQSFERMNAEVFQVPGLLDQMSASARGTIKDTELMKGLLTLTAGTTDEYARTLANISPQLLEIAKASNKLNPLLGDTSFLYESLTVAAKRQSVPIADNLGLIIKMDNAVQQVHPALQGLATDYDDLTQQQKFLNELLFQGDQLVNQVGGSVDSTTDNWLRLQVRVEEVTETFKRWLGEGLEPTVAALAGANAEIVEQTIDQTLRLETSQADLIARMAKVNEAWRLSNTLIGSFTGTSEAAADAMVKTGSQLALQADSAEDFIGFLKSAGIDIHTFQIAMGRSNLTQAESAEAFYEQTRAAKYAISATDQYRHSAGLTAEQIEELNKGIEQQSVDLEESAKRIEENRAAYEKALEAGERRRAAMEREVSLSEDVEDSAIRVERAYTDLTAKTKDAAQGTLDYVEAIKAEAEARREAAAATGDYFTQALEANQETSLFGMALDDLGKAYFTVGGRTDQQNKDLSDLQDAYDKAAQTLHEYEIGLRGAGMTSDEIAEKMAEQREEMGRLTGVMQPLKDITGEVVETQNNAVFSQTALNQALYDAADAAGADAFTLAALGRATGLLTDEQAKAALQAAAMQVKIAELGKLIAEGMGIDEALRKLGQFQEKLSEPYNAKAEMDTDDAEDRLHRVLRLLTDIDGRRARGSVEVTTHNKTVNDDLSDVKPPKTPDEKTGNKGQFGLDDFIVPPGFGNDSYPVWVSSGERVNVETAGEVARGGRGGRNVQIIDRGTTYHIYESAEAAALGQAMVAERRRQRLDQYMGVAG